MNRFDNRKFDQMRFVKITRNYLKYAEGSVLIEVGNTKVICAATIEERVPPFLKGSGQGWIEPVWLTLICAGAKTTLETCLFDQTTIV